MKILSIRERKPTVLKTSKAERAEALFIKYEKLALSAASAVSKRMGVRYSELQDEALSILGRLVFEQWDSFDVEKSCASTWIYTKVYRYLQNHCIRRGTRSKRESLLQDENHPATEMKRSPLEKLLAEVGDEGWALLRILFEAPGELAHSLTPQAPARSEASIRRYLTEGRWKPETIERAFSQVQHCLAS